MKDVAGKTAFITGGASGMGLGMAIAFVSGGALMSANVYLPLFLQTVAGASASEVSAPNCA